MHKALEGLAAVVERATALPFGQVRPVLRPPGALAEAEFLRTCYRCGACGDACPVKAIRSLQVDDDEIAGTPFIDPDLAACVLCESLACMEACPSGALRHQARHEVRMGLGRWSAEACLRPRGQECQVCVERCPIGPEAIRLADQRRVEVNATSCVGCGVCQQVCPARPKAIRVEPL